MYERWVDELRAELGVAEDVDMDDLLDLARVVAHKVERRAAPVTTFFVGLAAGRAGGDAAQVKDFAKQVMGRARAWTDEKSSETTTEEGGPKR